MTFQAVIFDLDGTLVDSETLAIKAGLHATQRLGFVADESFFHGLIGLDAASSKSLLAEEFGADNLARLDAAWGEEYQGLRQTELRLKPDVSRMLESLAELGMPRAVATSSSRESAISSLNAVGIADHFHALVTRDCVQNAKPHPESYLTAADRLCVAPETCLVFEDSEAGARSAAGAGMTVVVVPDIAPVDTALGHHRADTLLEGAAKAGLFCMA